MNNAAIRLMERRIKYLKVQIARYNQNNHENEYQRGIDAGIAIGHQLEVDDLTRIMNVLKGVEKDVSEAFAG